MLPLALTAGLMTSRHLGAVFMGLMGFVIIFIGLSEAPPPLPVTHFRGVALPRFARQALDQMRAHVGYGAHGVPREACGK